MSQKNSLTDAIPEVSLCRALLILTEVELIPPQTPLSDEILTTTFSLASIPSELET